MVRVAIAAVCLLGPLSPCSEAQQAADSDLPSLSGQIDSALADLKEIMGFGPRRPVRLSSMSRSKFRRLFERRARKEQKPRDVRNEVTFLRLFGLVPEGFDYRKAVLDLMSEQAWAIYDYWKGRMYIADWAPPEARQFALVHELVHAISDQQFGLRAFAEGARGSEQEYARMAAIEGQASWVMTEWVMRQSDRSLMGNRLLAITTASATRFEAEQFPVYMRSPLYFREALIFPYTDGLLFQHDLIEHLGTEGLRRAFERPPATTQQILEPELYLQELDPQPPELSSEALPRGYRRTFDGMFGQLEHRILLQHHLGDEDRSELLRQWRGARFEVLEHRRTRQAVLRYAVRWADQDAAREYFHLYRQVCERKSKDLRLLCRGEGRCEGHSAAGRTVLEVDGDVVRSTEGLPSP